MINSQQVAQHINETGKVVVGGGVTAGGTFTVFDLANLSQYAGIAAAVATALYFVTMTVIGILKYKKEKRESA